MQLRLIQHSPEATTTLVFIHAFPLSSAMWTDVTDRLRDTNVHMALADLPGFGLTTLTGFGDATAHEWTMRSAAEELYRRLKVEGLTDVTLVGLSMGGYLALAFYKAYPDVVKALVLADTKAAADDDKIRADREIFAQEVLELGMIAAEERQLTKLVGETTQREQPDIVQQVKRWIHQTDRQATANALRAMAAREDSTELLPLITVPVLLIVGQEDVITPPAAMEQVADRIADAQLHTIQGAGHLSAIERPEEFAGLVKDFIGP